MSKLRAAIYGFVVGDALGVPYEFASREVMKYSPATGMTGYGTHNQPPGTWSDDTTFMLCVLENLLEDGTPKTLKNKMLKCYKDGYLTPHGQLFDIGVATSLRINGNIHEQDKELNQGNGSLMRSLPYAFREDIRRASFEMHFDNKITHPDALCHLCCIFYVRLARSLLEGLTPNEAMKVAVGYIKFGWRITDIPDNKPYYDSFSILMSKTFSALSEEAIISSGHVIKTLEAVCWCLLNTTNYKDAVLKAVNLGGDTDTIAALTGGLAGILYGIEGIPVDWLDTLNNKTLIENILERTKQYDLYIP